MNAATTLSIVTDSFDSARNFTFEYTGSMGRKVSASGYLFEDKDGQIFLMKNSASLKSHYSDADRAERERLNSMEPVRDGDTVVVDGKQYQVKILGNFSDAGRLYAI
jgi:hypothetical protein